MYRFYSNSKNKRCIHSPLSIHPMYRFYGVGLIDRIINRYISIHPMYRFYTPLRDGDEERPEFQYILYIGFTHILPNRLQYYLHFNTSYVSVLLFRELRGTKSLLKFQYILCIGFTWHRG